jgi:predicted nuclease of predicted toxin-antitoxin system
MDERIRFHLNEHVDPAIAAALRRAGIDVTTTNEVGLRARDDLTHLRFAHLERRVIVTRDQDFLRRPSTMGIPESRFTPPTNRYEGSSKDLSSFMRL